MKRIFLMVAVALSFSACQQSSSSKKGGTPLTAMDVGSVIPAKFVQNNQQPEQTGCEGSGWRFDDRTLQGQKWSMVRDVKRPGLTAHETLVATIEDVQQNKVTMTNDANLAIEGNQPQAATFTTDAVISGSNPEVTATPDNPSSAAAMVEIMKFENDQRCKFEPQGQAQTETKTGSFSLAGGQEIHAATLTTETQQGSWKCVDDQGATVAEQNNAKKTSQTVSTFEIPGFMPFEQCAANPVYIYVTITDPNNAILESSREEIQKFEQASTPTGGATPTP